MNKKLNCILFIDDDEPTNFLNRMTVEQMDCTRHVVIAQSGEEALDILMGQDNTSAGADCSRPDLIFLDINMPAMDGWEFLEKYGQLPEEKKASIILVMLTTSLNPDDERRASVTPEIAGFENKPLKEPQLQRLLKKYFPENF
jgi:CheY-like chemotaxis protein